MKKKWDLWLIAAVLVLAATVWIFLKLHQKPGAYVVVRVDGTEQGRYLLGEDLETEIVTENGSNRLVIADGQAKVTWADCPDKLCVNQKAIHYEGESIVCLPHKLTVTIEGGETGSLDGVAGN